MVIQSIDIRTIKQFFSSSTIRLGLYAQLLTMLFRLERSSVKNVTRRNVSSVAVDVALMPHYPCSRPVNTGSVSGHLAASATAEVLSAGDVRVTVVGQRTAVGLQADPAAPALRPRRLRAAIESTAHSVPPFLHPVEAVSPAFLRLASSTDFRVQLSTLIRGTKTNSWTPVFSVHDPIRLCGLTQFHVYPLPLI